jgi:hypothetical protein
MKWQPTAVLAAVAVGIGAYIYFVERPKPTSAGDDKTVYAWNLSDVQAEPWSRIAVKVGTSSVVYLKTQPTPTPKPTPDASGSVPTPDPLVTPPQPTWHDERHKDWALTYQWDTSFSDFKRLIVDRVVEEKTTDEKIYDFASPSVEITVGTDKKPDLYTLVVGKKGMTGNGYYLKTNQSPKVYLVANYKVENWVKLVSEPPVATPTPGPSPSPSPSPTTAPATK